MNAPPQLDFELPAVPASVGEARARVGDYAQDVGASVEDVRLALSEAVGNAVAHAYRGGTIGSVRVSARLSGPILELEVADRGNGMTPHIDSPGLGVGISVITKLARTVTFDSTENGTTVRMTFPIGGERVLADMREGEA